MGNSGSGKSWFAARIAEALGCKAVDLDAIHWEPGGYGLARDKQVAIDMVRQDASGPAWVIEGVFGWLLQEALPRATALIWLDLPVSNAWIVFGTVDCAAAAMPPRSRRCWAGRRIARAGRRPARR